MSEPLTREKWIELQGRLKTILETEIRDAIESFTKCSGLRVDSVYIDYTLDQKTVHVRAEVKL